MGTDSLGMVLLHILLMLDTRERRVRRSAVVHGGPILRTIPPTDSKAVEPRKRRVPRAWSAFDASRLAEMAHVWRRKSQGQVHIGRNIESRMVRTFRFGGRGIT